MRSLYFRLVILFSVVLPSYCAFSQVKHQDAKFPLLGTVNWHEVPDRPEQLPVLASPIPKTERNEAKQKIIAEKHRAAIKWNKESGAYQENKKDLNPEVSDGYLGINLAAGVPNDNYMAISNDGSIVNVLNTWVTLLNEEGTIKSTKTLAAFVAGALGRLDRFYDPKVLYDPQNDRFILVFLEGSTSEDSRIVMGFSGSGNPEEKWRFYALNGTPFGGKFWSDYPIIAHNGEDVFVTVNILRDSMSWQEGFTESVIWQINKESGYNGDSLQTRLWSEITYGGKPVWSICAAQPAEGGVDKDMYFFSVRPADETNDTVFIHYLSNTLRSGNANLSMEVVTVPLKYGVPPPAEQPTQLDTPMLQTNDARVLSAFRYRNELQWVQTTRIPSTLRSGVLHSIYTMGNSPKIQSAYIQDEVLEFAYPSIAWIGSEHQTSASAITFSHSSKVHHPGTSVIVSNRLGKGPVQYSEVVMTREGDSIINHPNLHGDERWGDYTQVQRRFNKPNEFWICGTFGNDRGLYGTWINSLQFDVTLSLPEVRGIYKAFPVPSSKYLNLEFDLDVTTMPFALQFDLFSIDGKKIQTYTKTVVQSAYQDISLDLGHIPSGVYLLKNNAGMKALKIVVE